MAILQFLQGKPSEEKVFRCFRALERFCCLSKREVPQFVKMIGKRNFYFKIVPLDGAKNRTKIFCLI